MLQARQLTCILIILAAISLPSAAPAQDAQESRRSGDFKRLGSEAVENEPVLDLSLPEPETRPESPEQAAERRERERQAEIADGLEAARGAMRDGRVDQPPERSAWTYYRQVLGIDPGNSAALDGLTAVQRAMVNRAVGYARELDFETAGRLLDDAAMVREEQGPVEEARAEIEAFRADYSAELEVEAITAMDAGRFDQAERALIGLVALGGVDAQVSQLRRRLEEARVYGGLEPGQVIRDHFMDGMAWSPESVIVRAGSYMMGSTAFEDGRLDHEGPQHRVTFRRGFAIGRTEVTVEQFRAFVEKARYRTDAEKQGHSMVYDHHSGRLIRRDRIHWEYDYEGRRAADDLPVVHVSFNDAIAYVKWLSRGTGKPYRLPTEAEFEYALRAGRSGPYWWGEGTPSEVVENLTGERDISRNRRQWETYFEDYGDRHWGPAPAASFKANPFGLFDMGGNVAEWIMDCWHDSYIRAPDDGSAWVNPGCENRVVRGAYWASAPQQARSAYRLQASPTLRDGRVGFRIARDL